MEKEMNGKSATGLLLVVEDDINVSRQLAGFLKKHGYRCVTAAGIQSARQVLLSNNVDLIVSDFDLEDGNAAEIVRQFETDGLSFPTIILSGAGSRRLSEVSGMHAVKMVLHKPVELSELLNAVAKWMPEKQRRRCFRSMIGPEEREFLLMDSGKGFGSPQAYACGG